MAHTYQSITAGDRTYTPQSDMTPEGQSITAGSRTYTPQSDMTPEGTITETLTWAAINTDYDTWLELLDSGKQHWSDWYTITPWTDSWTSKTRSDRTYGEVTA